MKKVSIVLLILVNIVLSLNHHYSNAMDYRKTAQKSSSEDLARKRFIELVDMMQAYMNGSLSLTSVDLDNLKKELATLGSTISRSVPR